MAEKMIANLQTDLLQVDLEDFIEHFEEFITHPSLRQFFKVEWGAVLFDRITFDDGVGFQPQPLTDKEAEYVGSRGHTRIFVRKKRTRFECLIYVFPKGIEPAYASLQAARYRPGELLISAYDFYNWGFVEQLKEWLKERWEYKDLDLSDVSEEHREMIREYVEKKHLPHINQEIIASRYSSSVATLRRHLPERFKDKNMNRKKH